MTLATRDILDEDAAGAVANGPQAGVPSRRWHGGRAWLAELVHDKFAFASALFLFALVAVAVLAPLIAPHDPATQMLRDRLQPPAWQDGGSWMHPLGTDALGRDVASRLMFGSRVSLLVGGLSVLLSAAFGITMGLIAGYFGGRRDAWIMRLVDTQFAFPGLLLAISMISAIGAKPSTLIIVLSVLNWMVFARFTRAMVLSIRQMPYVSAAEFVGASRNRIIARHILPNLTAPLLTLAVLEFARMIIAEASLSFLGLGIQPPATSWGLDLSLGREHIFTSWWLVTLPGILLALTVLSANVVAGWLRVAADPQERDKRFSAAAGVATVAR